MTTFSKKSMPIWTTKSEIVVIEFYRDHSFLWDPKNKMYYNRDAREMALQDLADSLGSDEAGRPFTSNDVKDKFKNMRAVYGREQVKVDQTRKWGTAEDVYEPKWLHFPRMQTFLFNVFKPRAAGGGSKESGAAASATNSRSSYSTTMEEDDREEEDVVAELRGLCGDGAGPQDEEEPDMDGNERAHMSGHRPITYVDDGYYDNQLLKQHDDDEDDENMPILLTDTPSPQLVVMGGPHKKARCSRKQLGSFQPTGGSTSSGRVSGGGGDGRYLVEALKMMREERDKRLDPDESFCDSVAGTLRRLSPYNRERAKMEIQKLLFQIEFGEMSAANEEPANT